MGTYDNTAERELYLFCKCTKPFALQLSAISQNRTDLLEDKVKQIREVVSAAIEKYCSDYCSEGNNPFEEVKERVIKIIAFDIC